MKTNRPHLETDHEILEFVTDEFTTRLRNGEFPTIAEYQNLYPQLSKEIDELLAPIAMLEQLKEQSDSRPSHPRRLDQAAQLTHLGNYQIVREVGRGGMGIVFEATHESLGKQVAIKVMPTPLTNTDNYLQRFEREAQAAAKLHHTNIVSVFEAGEHEGFHYYVMDFIAGASLSEIIFGLNQHDDTPPADDSTCIDLGKTTARNSDKLRLQIPAAGSRANIVRASDFQTTYQREIIANNPIDPHAVEHFRWVAHIGSSIADALAYAHTANILHRDIKPANIMLDTQGIPWVTDFGLAKDSSSEINLTKTGDVIGTPQYLAPESLEGKYDQQSEIYCLGLTLYELATLRPAHRSGSTAEVIRAIATTSPPAPRKVNPRIPIDLSTIISKAISRDPQSRYATIAEFRDDLLAFIDDRPIVARRPSIIETATRWSRRNPLSASLSAISLLLLMLVAISATAGYWATTTALSKEAEKTRRLEIQQQQTEQARAQSQQNLELMKAQHARAEANIAMTIEAFDTIFRQIISQGTATKEELDVVGFREISGIETSLTNQHAAVLNNLLPFYEKFATLNADNERLKSEAAKAFRRVGNIYQRVGDTPNAIQAYKRSANLYQSIYEQDPTSKSALLVLVQTQNELSAVSRKNGNGLAAYQKNQESLSLLEQSPLVTTDPKIRLELARTLSAMGFNLFQDSTLATTRPPQPGHPPRSHDRQRSRRRSAGPPPFRPLDPPRPKGKRSSRPWSEMMRLGKRGTIRRDIQATEQAIKIMDDLIAESPDNAEYQSVRATCYCVLAAVRLHANQSEGQSMRDRAIEAFESLVKTYPDDPQYRYLLAMACALGKKPPHPNDRLLLERSIEIVETLLEQFPALLDYHHLYASLKIKMAGQLIRDGKPKNAFDELLAAKTSIETLIKHTPSDRSFMRTINALNQQLQHLAKTYQEQGKLTQANQIKTITRQLRSQLRKEKR